MKMKTVEVFYHFRPFSSLLKTTPGVLVMSSRVGLCLLDGSGRTAWSSNTTGASASSVAQLLGSGNLVVREKSSSAVFQWQSFDHPQNTLLAGMRFGKNLKTGMEWSLTSWRAQDDPATGDYRRVMDTRGLPDIVTWHGNAKKYRAGPWNGRWFSGVPEMDSGYKLFSVQMVDGPDEVTYVLNTTAGIPFTRVVLDEVGKVRVLMWLPASRVWKEYPWLPRDACDEYASCGAFGLCNVDAAPTPSCSCDDLLHFVMVLTLVNGHRFSYGASWFFSFMPLICPSKFISHLDLFLLLRLICLLHFV
jgi:hypothetical protein